MSRYNRYLDGKFQGCMIVERKADDAKQRVITVYAIPGEPGVVGLFDGVDAWVTGAAGLGKHTEERAAAVSSGRDTGEVESGQTRRRYADGTLRWGQVGLFPLHEVKRRARAAVSVSGPPVHDYAPGFPTPRPRVRAVVAPPPPAAAPTRERRRAV